MTADLKNTGTCHYTGTKETFWGTYVFTVLPKNSPYTESISMGYYFIHANSLKKYPVPVLF